MLFRSVRGTRAARKRYSAALVEHFAKTDRRVEQALPFLLSSQECLATRLESPEEDSEKENRDVGEGSSHGFLRLIPNRSLSPIPIPAPRKKPSLEKVTQDLWDEFAKERKKFFGWYGSPVVVGAPVGEEQSRAAG